MSSRKTIDEDIKRLEEIDTAYVETLQRLSRNIEAASKVPSYIYAKFLVEIFGYKLWWVNSSIEDFMKLHSEYKHEVAEYLKRYKDE